MMEQVNTDKSPLAMQEWVQQTGLHHLNRIRVMFNRDPDEEFEEHLELLSTGKSKGLIYYAAGIKKQRHSVPFRQLDIHERQAVRKATLALWVDLNSIPRSLI
ncbi:MULTISPECIES: DUF5347 domain-containing protein [Yersinia]|uniref:DUF5347 domain-containing protein n=1 Tax=Yersinia TaxID=629 RepID=UPI001F0900B1|nr:DUF5347 domain-containing protein [Yersinia sp. IP36721]